MGLSPRRFFVLLLSMSVLLKKTSASSSSQQIQGKEGAVAVTSLESEEEEPKNVAEDGDGVVEDKDDDRNPSSQARTCVWKTYADDDEDENDDDDVRQERYYCSSNSYYNHAMHADNIIEVDVPEDVVTEIRRDYERDVQPHWHTNRSTEDFCLVAPYAPGVQTWGSFVDDEAPPRSDIRWYSVNNQATYDRYLDHVRRLGLLDRIRELGWIWGEDSEEEEELTVFSIFFIPRSFSNRHEFHEDWSEEVGTQVVTFLVPLSDSFTIGLAYKDEDNAIRTYNYTLGKAIGVGGGNLHSTGVGKSDTQDVLLCVYIGGKNEKMWKYTQANIADELEHYHHPFKGFIRNEYLKGRSSKCQ